MKPIKKQTINFEQISGFLASAERRLSKARKILEIDEQSGYQAAYDAMLKASLAFMLSLGKRPRSTIGHHKVIIEFVGEKLGHEYAGLIRNFDIMRRKRNQAIYEPFSTISENEVNNAVETARQYLKIVIEDIRRRDPQRSLGI
ncbi:MAG: HEPN domain-containing protein [bacterium]|nr:HEPN domain-containing protein [bacterium]